LVSHWIPFEFMENAAVKNFNKDNFKVIFSKTGMIFKSYKIK